MQILGLSGMYLCCGSIYRFYSDWFWPQCDVVHFWERVGWPYGHVCVMFVAYWVVCCGHFGLLECVWGMLWKGCMLWSLLGGSLGADNHLYLHIKATVSM